MRFRKGPYRASDGDFAAAGSVAIDYLDRLDAGIARLELGSYGHVRALFADSFELGEAQRLLVAVETRHDILTSSGHAALDHAAVVAVRKWRFDGGPGVVEVPVEFVLAGAGGRRPAAAGR